MDTMNLAPASQHVEQVDESGQEETRPCMFPPIKPAQSPRRDKEDQAITELHEQQGKLEDNTSLLVELARIEHELRESMRREEERQQALDYIRQEENRQRWRNLCYLSLNQRTTKPWVSSYYKNIPMHIYCLPIQTVARRRTKKKKRTI